MQEQYNIIDCYDRTASNYADQYKDELNHKHLDLLLLNAFAAENRTRGKCIDLGCGPGQTTQYLTNCRLKELLGADISPVMIKVAKAINPLLQFETADMLRLHYPVHSFGSVIAFYSIVHFDCPQLTVAFTEIRRILKDTGQFPFSFHIGDQLVHLDEFLDQSVNIGFHFFDPVKIRELFIASGFEIIDSLEREHYPAVEYPIRRAYILVKAKPFPAA